MRLNQLYSLDKNSAIPLYFQVKEGILHLIKEGTYPPGFKLPTEQEYCVALDISRPTIRQAFLTLEKEGYVERIKAKGTYVAKPKVDGYFFKKINSFNDEMQALGLNPSTVVLHQKLITADEHLAQMLQVAQGSEVFYLERLRYASGDVMVYVQTYAPLTQLQQFDFSSPDISLYDTLHQLGHNIHYVDRQVEAKNADEQLAKLLETKQNDAYYSITSKAYNAQQQLLEYSIAHYRGDRNTFSLRLYKQD